MSDSDAAWRDPLQVVTGASHPVDPRLLLHRTHGPFWELLDEAGIRLLVSREYEHLLMALSGRGGRREITYLPVPHPSGVAFDAARGMVHVASTRNPNQVLELEPVASPGWRHTDGQIGGGPLIPVRTAVLPGRLYLHDLAIIGGRLHGNAVGHDAVIRIGHGTYVDVWTPKVIEEEVPGRGVNFLQLNSIAAGRSLTTSYFTASTDRPGDKPPGHPAFPVDGRGVVFSGRTREPVVRGLTRPHSARISANDDRLWVLNSGYGELGTVDIRAGRFEPVIGLPGWTRGLALHGHLAIVATSRVLPRFHQYAPGLDPDACMCGVHIIDLSSGTALASLRWKNGDQIFAVEAVPAHFTSGLPAGPNRGAGRRDSLFYDFTPKSRDEQGPR